MQCSVQCVVRSIIALLRIPGEDQTHFLFLDFNRFLTFYLLTFSTTSFPAVLDPNLMHVFLLKVSCLCVLISHAAAKNCCFISSVNGIRSFSVHTI